MAKERVIPETEAGWKAVKILLEGIPTIKGRGFRFKRAQELEPVLGAGDEVLEYKAGNRSNEGMIKLLRGDLRKLNLAARASGGNDILDIEFDIALVYVAEGNRGLATDVLVGFKVESYEQSMEQGDKYMVVELPGKFLALESEDAG